MCLHSASRKPSNKLASRAMTLGRHSYSSFLFLCFHVLSQFHTTSDAALSSHPVQAIRCSTSGNYTSTSTYAANLNQFLATLPEKAVSKNGGFFNGTVGEGPDTIYGLAMCSADYSRSDCGDCLAATASGNANGLPNRCPGSTTVVALFDPCLVRYSNKNFFGTAEIGAGPIYRLPGASVSGNTPYSDAMVKSLKEETANAVTSPQRFSASASDPYTLVQCTWDLPPDQCKQCLDVLSANATESDWFTMTIEGKRKSYSCTVRYSNTSFVVVPFGGAPTPQSVDQATSSPTQFSSASSKGSLTIRVVGSVVGLILLACLAALIRYVQRLRSERNTKGLIRRFTYSELEKATREFTEEIGKGAFGTVYKGIILEDNKSAVAIKKHKLGSTSNEERAHLENKNEERAAYKKRAVAIKKHKLGASVEERAAAIAAFNNEIDIMSPLNHCNIIRLVGWCNEKSNLFLVYELVEDHSLEARLYSSGASVDAERYGVRAPGASLVLDWQKRYNILIGIASGLEYLHTKCTKSVLHMDIKPGNVMLDKHFNAKLCDFGLVTQLTHAITSRSTDVAIGSKGYMDPAYQRNYKITRGSDVYSFGVLLLEVICGMKPELIREIEGGPVTNSLIQKVRESTAIIDAAHPLLRGEFDEEIKGALFIGLRCVETRPSDRPAIQVVLSDLLRLAARSSPRHCHTRPVYDEV